MATLQGFGAQSMVAPLKDVLLVPPGPMTDAACSAVGWTVFDYKALVAEFDGLANMLRAEGVRVHLGAPSLPSNPDAIYAYDALLVTQAGLVLLRPGKQNRRAEPEVQSQLLTSLGVPVVGQIEAPGVVESGDLLWLSEHVLCVGIGWRTNRSGAEQLRALLAPLSVEVHTFDLPNFQGPDHCLHLMSLLSLVSPSHAVVAERFMPVRLMQLLKQHNIATLSSPESEFDTLGTNILALGHGKVVALEHNTLTNARLRQAGIDVLTCSGAHLCIPGTGGPTCLTRQLWRYDGVS